MQTETQTQTWLITGANGNLGKRLVRELLAGSLDSVVAVVRSERARQALDDLGLDASVRERLRVIVLDYTDVAALHAAAIGCDRLVHLVGILKQTKAASYLDAHEHSTAALLSAVVDTPVKHLTYLSIVGSHRDADNICLASKGRAEDLCREDPLATCVLRVPMVLGEGDYASYALRARGSKSTSFSFRASSMEQPIYAGDVVQAVLAAGRRGIDATLELGGPEVLSRHALTARAAAVLGRDGGRVISLPLVLGLAMAGIMEVVSGNPPVTRAMLDVLDHDDNVDAGPACEALGIAELTPLDDMLRAVLT